MWAGPVGHVGPLNKNVGWAGLAHILGGPGLGTVQSPCGPIKCEPGRAASLTLRLRIYKN
ncbi:hypothetical protein TorRG33x02_221650 [Trema orientale]|uniref:Uncharacterized protein n=1 Tax=Trema orientale TaxID=63057 RepID=A0A2P5E922_TREOI|nr:hypothetical protein TorRG33x02_221650 [Trema orientale]